MADCLPAKENSSFFQMHKFWKVKSKTHLYPFILLVFTYVQDDGVVFLCNVWVVIQHAGIHCGSQVDILSHGCCSIQPNGIKAVCLCVLLITYKRNMMQSDLFEEYNYLKCCKWCATYSRTWVRHGLMDTFPKIYFYNQHCCSVCLFVFVLYVLLDHCCIWRLALANESHITRRCHGEICTKS